jgi:hypothetical protein
VPTFDVALGADTAATTVVALEAGEPESGCGAAESVLSRPQRHMIVASTKRVSDDARRIGWIETGVLAERKLGSCSRETRPNLALHLTSALGRCAPSRACR